MLFGLEASGRSLQQHALQGPGFCLRSDGARLLRRPPGVRLWGAAAWRSPAAVHAALIVSPCNSQGLHLNAAALRRALTARWRWAAHSTVLQRRDATPTSLHGADAKRGAAGGVRAGAGTDVRQGRAHIRQ